jgi:hypothetical protein
MSEYEKYQMNTMRKSGIAMTQISGHFASLAGGCKKFGYSKRYMYNSQFKRKWYINYDVEEAAEFFKDTSMKDDMLFKYAGP